MARIDLTNKVVHAKLVYYGPGLCGKTTNLEYVAKNLGGGGGNELMSLATEGDRTIFFDFLPLDLGTLRGLTVQFKLYTVPGQVRYNETRKMVLKNADGIVFVADSQEPMMDANLQSLDDLYANLRALGIDSEKVAIILQYNKRDLPTAVPTSVLDKALNGRGYPTFAASARTGEGVVETLKYACAQVLKTLAVELPENRHEAAASPTRAKTPAAQVPAPVRASALSEARGDSGSGVTAAAPKISPARTDLAPVPQPDLEPSLRALLAESSRVLGSLKEHVGKLRASEEAKPVGAVQDTAALEKMIGPLATKADLGTLARRMDDLAASMKPQAPLEDDLPKKVAQLVAGKEDVASLRAAVAQLLTTHKADFDVLAGRMAQLPRDVEVLLAESTKNVRELQAELTALREVRDATPPPVPHDVLERLATKEDLATLERRMAELPSKSELEALNRSSVEMLAGVKGLVSSLGELLAAERDHRTDAELHLANDLIEKLATRADLAALEGRLRALPDRAADWGRPRGEPFTKRPTVNVVPTRVPPPLAEIETALADQGACAGEGDAVPAAAPTGAAPDAQVETGATTAAPSVGPPEPAAEASPVAPEQPAEAVPDDEAAQAPSVHPATAAQGETAAATLAETAAPAPAQVETAAVQPEIAAPTQAETVQPETTAPTQTETAAVQQDTTAPAQAETAAVQPETTAPTQLETAEPAQAKTAEPPQAEAPPAPPPEPAQPPDERHVNAARVARVMVADLYLYHKEAVETGLRQDDFFERNKEALADMRATYESRVPQDVRDQSDYLEKAIRELIAKKRTQLGLG